MFEMLMQHIDAQHETVIELQRQLVASPALGPDNAEPGCPAEMPKARFCIDYLRSIGIDDIIEVHAPDERVAGGLRPNLVCVVPGKNTGRTFWVISHLDVVPSGDLSLWDSDPFTLRVEGDMIYGRGVEDNNGGIVSSLLLAKALLEKGLTPEINYGVMLVSDEETGSVYGLDHLLKTRPDLFGQDDLFLAPDFGDPDSATLLIAEKSIFWIKVIVKGKQCHASRPSQGINTLRASAAMNLELDQLAKQFSAVDPLFSPSGSTFEPTKKEANVPNINTVPGLDVFYVDCRVLPQYPLAEVMEAIRVIGATIEAKYGVSISYESVQEAQAAPITDPKSPIVTRLAAGIKSVYGVEAKPQGIGGGTVAAFLRRRGYPAAVWATCVHNAHQPNERSRISTQIGDAKVFAHVLMSGE